MFTKGLAMAADHLFEFPALDSLKLAPDLRHHELSKNTNI